MTGILYACAVLGALFLISLVCAVLVSELRPFVCKTFNPPASAIACGDFL